MKTAELIHPKWMTLTKGLQVRFLRLWCNPSKNGVGEQQTFENNVLFSDNLLPFPPLTARTENSTNPVYLLKRHLLSPLPSLGYSHTTAFPSVHLSSRHHFFSILIPSQMTWEQQVSCGKAVHYVHANFSWDNPRQNHRKHPCTVAKAWIPFSSQKVFSRGKHI